ncbi:MAG: valine--tRNA ligase [Chitinophagales bacterium]|jgi:valyl-tRNA synthetase|nr:valine--tRNA ligase [Chitinophagales bacterium]
MKDSIKQVDKILGIYNAKEVEEKWKKFWLENKTFSAQIEDNRPSYTVFIPPPNVTGVLHMGHVLNNTLQDFFIRKARKEGKNAVWIPGTDHASIATEAKVVKMLRERQIKKSDLTREEFLNYAFEWREKYGGIIDSQLKAIGAGLDWDRYHFTMDEDYYKAVIRVFVDLYRKGYIYRGLKMLNWDCEAKTVVSNEEVIYSETLENATLFHIRYQIEATQDYVIIATTRPETIFADTAIAIHPNDERYAHLKGKNAIIPLINRAIPIIYDEYVDKEFGTGCLKVTPAHDVNDYEIGLRHDLPVIDILNEDGSLNENCGYSDFVGKDRFEVRKLSAIALENSGSLVKKEQIQNKIGRSERTNSVIEPRLTLQWFIKMKDFSYKAHMAVMNDEIILHPAHFKNTYNHWMSNVKDWCISRQLWWGHRIPAYFLPNGSFVVAETIEEALVLAQEIDSNYTLSDLKQDEDVLDTWASSWLWPIQVFEGFNDESFDKVSGKVLKKNNPDLQYFYPSQILVTAPEILFFWVARMIILGIEYLDEKPFNTVFLTGIVRDNLGRKMSKQLGNSPDIFESIDKFSVDGIRFGITTMSSAGNDIIFDEKYFEQGRNFINKLWNSYKLTQMWTVKETSFSENQPIIDWFGHRINQAVEIYLKEVAQLRINEAIRNFYTFVWDDYCSWYLELIKPAYQQPIDQITLTKTIEFFKIILSVLNPIMPFFTEELWSIVHHGKPDQLLLDTPHPIAHPYDGAVIDQMRLVTSLIQHIREQRSNLSLKNTEMISISMHTDLYIQIESMLSPIQKLTATSEIYPNAEMTSTNSFLIGNFIVFVHSQKKVDESAKKNELISEIEYLKGFVASVEAKLSNERFVSKAPENVVSLERKKRDDALQKIMMLENLLSQIL